MIYQPNTGFSDLEWIVVMICFTFAFSLMAIFSSPPLGGIIFGILGAFYGLVFTLIVLAFVGYQIDYRTNKAR